MMTVSDPHTTEGLLPPTEITGERASGGHLIRSVTRPIRKVAGGSHRVADQDPAPVEHDTGRVAVGDYGDVEQHVRHGNEAEVAELEVSVHPGRISVVSQFEISAAAFL